MQPRAPRHPVDPSPTNDTARRALAAAVLAVIYADAARALGRDELDEKTGAVHAAMQPS